MTLGKEPSIMGKLPTEREDDIDRRNKSASAKLAQLRTMIREQTGDDPSHYTYLGKPHVVHACVEALPDILKTAVPRISFDSSGHGDGDVVFVWEGIKVRVRHNARGDVMHAIRTRELPPSTRQDRVVAGHIRMGTYTPPPPPELPPITPMKDEPS